MVGVMAVDGDFAKKRWDVLHEGEANESVIGLVEWSV